MVSEFTRDRLLFNILDYRMENKLTTFFTSNLSKEDLKEHYTFDKKVNGNLMMAERLLERISISKYKNSQIATHKKQTIKQFSFQSLIFASQ